MVADLQRNSGKWQDIVRERRHLAITSKVKHLAEIPPSQCLAAAPPTSLRSIDVSHSIVWSEAFPQKSFASSNLRALSRMDGAATTIRRKRTSGRCAPAVAPRMLTKEQAAAYCGISAPVFAASCSVRPTAMGRSDRLLRYDIRKIDRWLDGLGGSGQVGERYGEPDWLAEMDRNDGVDRTRQRH